MRSYPVSPSSRSRAPISGGQGGPVQLVNPALALKVRGYLRAHAPKIGDLTVQRSEAAKSRGFKLSYDPTNLTVYSLAYAGAQAGFIAGRAISSTNPLDYADMNVAAGIWAQEFDTLWDSSAAIDEVQAMGIALQSYAVWESRSPTIATATQVAPLVNAILTNIAEAETLLALQGITPPTWGTGGGGGGGWVLEATATVSSHPALSRGLWLVQPVDSSGGTFPLVLPASPDVGDLIEIPDWGAQSATTGVFTNAVTIEGTAVPIQNPHTMAVSGSVFNYTFGQASGDGGGSTLNLQCASNDTFPKFWKAWLT
jgi:hypothetical protein